MSDSAPKRKQGPGGSDGSVLKKRKEGTGGRWKTPAQKAKQASWVEMGKALEVGDEGIWVTYARGMKNKAVREFTAMCHEYGEKLYDIKPPADDSEHHPADAEANEDIETSIEKELERMKAPAKPRPRGVFSPVSVTIECVFFMKTMRPVDPCQLVREMCLDAQRCGSPMERKCKYINRLTPVVDTEKASEKGVRRVARKVLQSVFRLNEEEVVDENEDSEEGKKEGEEEEKPVEESTGAEEVNEVEEEEEEKEKKTGEVKDAAEVAVPETESQQTPFTYAIRHTMRNHTVLESQAVIKMIAGMIKPEHKVNLKSPDKVILVEIFQLFCGISVVDGREWEELKRYNINVLYGMAGEQKSGGGGKAVKASSDA
ncbi:hypothetical protein CCMA1212_000038 [Trichoderma ghanense]|uniref:THUMP domain-containing protein n=1 Tax=Trichoderma ghanense TaxID=65468 RepID=A0ABY2HGQ8_9HYPO